MQGKEAGKGITLLRIGHHPTQKKRVGMGGGGLMAVGSVVATVVVESGGGGTFEEVLVVGMEW